MLENVLRDLLKIRLIKILENDDNNGVDDILNIIYDIDDYDGSLDDLRYYENEEDFFNIYYYGNPIEVARACTYGNYNFMDAYVKINSHGNLTSICYYGLKRELKESMNEIIDRAIALKDEVFRYNDILTDINDEYEKIEEIYDILDNEIDEGFESNIECVVDDFYNILESVNDGFSLDIDIEANYNCIPTYKFVLSLNYEEDDIEVIYILDFEDDDKNNITFLEIEDVKIMEV